VGCDYVEMVTDMIASRDEWTLEPVAVDEGSRSKTVVRIFYSLSWICSLYWHGINTSDSQSQRQTV